MIELRWLLAKPEKDRTSIMAVLDKKYVAAKLQYRVAEWGEDDHYNYSEWQDVPMEVMPSESV